MLSYAVTTIKSETRNLCLPTATISPRDSTTVSRNHSALEYQVSEDKRSGIKSDPNRPDEERVHRPPRGAGRPRERGDGEDRGQLAGV